MSSYKRLLGWNQQYFSFYTFKQYDSNCLVIYIYVYFIRLTDMYKYTISIIGEDSISSLFMAYQSLLSIGIVKIKNKQFIFIATSWLCQQSRGFSGTS